MPAIASSCHWSHWTKDLATFIDIVKTREPCLPVFLLGHSAGGVIAYAYALEHQDEIAGFICEDFAYQVSAPDIALAIVKGISTLKLYEGHFHDLLATSASSRSWRTSRPGSTRTWRRPRAAGASDRMRPRLLRRSGNPREEQTMNSLNSVT